MMKDQNNTHSTLRLQISKISAMVDLGSKFSDAVSVNHLLSLILKQTLDLMSVGVCIIWLKDKHGNLIPRISFGLRTKLIQSLKVRRYSSLMKRVMATDCPTTIYDLRAQTHFSLDTLARKEGLRSLLAAPIAFGDETIGVLMVCTKDSPRHFTDADLKVFNALAKQSALAITDIGLYERMDKKVKEKMKEMSMLFTMSRSLSSSIDLESLLYVILEKAAVLMKASFCTLKLLDRSRRRLHLVASVGAGKHTVHSSARRDDVDAEVMKNGTHYVAHTALRKGEVYSVIAVPLFSQRRKTGVLSAYVRGTKTFTEEEVDMFEMVASLCSMAVDNATMLERVRNDYFNTVKTLARIIDENDTYTRGHCDKVMRYSLSICKRMRLEPRRVNAIKIASILHDIGKIGVDMNILHKEGKLTDEEWKKVKMHPEIGAKIVGQIGFLNEAVPIIRHHHERFDGGGYPEPDRSGGKIPIGARILAVADSFDAMTSDRPYRKAMSREEALAELKRCAGTQFDPEIVNAFCKS